MQYFLKNKMSIAPFPSKMTKFLIKIMPRTGITVLCPTAFSRTYCQQRCCFCLRGFLSVNSGIQCVFSHLTPNPWSFASTILQHQLSDCVIPLWHPLLELVWTSDVSYKRKVTAPQHFCPPDSNSGVLGLPLWVSWFTRMRHRTWECPLQSAPGLL